MNESVSEMLYVRLNFHTNIACSQRHLNTCHTSFTVTYYEHTAREREGERERERCKVEPLDVTQNRIFPMG